MKVVLSTIGKFHTFDLARQLAKRNSLGAVFSGYPWMKLKSERIPREKVWTFPWVHAPYMRLAPQKQSPLRIAWEWYDRISFDRYVSRSLPECNLFCGLSGTALYTARVATGRGAAFVCDRGSSHIRFQNKILHEEYELQGRKFGGIDPRVIEREESEYELADAITVPSSFVLNTFLEMGIPRTKLRLVPYGVDLSSFHKIAEPSTSEFQVLFAGSLTPRKGLAYLLEAFEKLQHRGKRLVVAGSGADIVTLRKRYSAREDIKLLGHVGRWELVRWMSTSHVMVLPSVEEGLALVQAQAMACGCPVIATTNTGGANLFADGVEGYIVPIRDADAIADRLQRIADDPMLQRSLSEASLRRVQSIGGWDTYGEVVCGVFQSLASSAEERSWASI